MSATNRIAKHLEMAPRQRADLYLDFCRCIGDLVYEDQSVIHRDLRATWKHAKDVLRKENRT